MLTFVQDVVKWLTTTLGALALDDFSYSLSLINLLLAKSSLGIVLGEQDLSVEPLSTLVIALSPSSGSSSSFCVRCY